VTTLYCFVPQFFSASALSLLHPGMDSTSATVRAVQPGSKVIGPVPDGVDPEAELAPDGGAELTPDGPAGGADAGPDGAGAELTSTPLYEAADATFDLMAVGTTAELAPTPLARGALPTGALPTGALAEATVDLMDPDGPDGTGTGIDDAPEGFIEGTPDSLTEWMPVEPDGFGMTSLEWCPG